MYRKICSIFFIIIPFINILANTADKEKKIKGNFDIGMNINKGTQNIFQLNNVFHLSYKNKQSLYSIKNNISILSTSKGVISHKRAKKLGVGGEIICEVY